MSDQRDPEWQETDEEVIAQIIEMLKILDNTSPDHMSPLFYQHWFEQLNMSIRISSEFSASTSTDPDQGAFLTIKTERSSDEGTCPAVAMPRPADQGCRGVS